MRTRAVTVLCILILAATLAACDAGATGGQPAASSPAASTTTSAGGPAAGQTPGAQRGGGGGGFNGTPGAQRGGGGGPGFNGTPGANGGGNPGGRATAQAAATATAQAAAPAQPAATGAVSAQAGSAPTAVLAPVIVIPTAIPASQASNNPSHTPVGVPSTSPAPRPVVATPVSGAPAPSMADLKGKIIFFTDRSGSYPELWMMNADGSNQQLCNCSDLLQTMVTNETISPDKQQFLYVRTVGSARSGDIQIWRHNNSNNTDEPVTGGAPGFPGVDYAPVWSPDSKHIAWVTETNGPDEIYLYDASENSNVRLTQSSGEWYKHPSFSPDGSHITFWSNLGDLNYKQIWTMKLDGSGKLNLSSNSFNDWDPIWVK